VVQNLHPNNTNLNITNITTTTTKREKDAVVAVNFKKLKEKGDLSASTCAYPHADRCNAQAEEKMQAPYSSKEKEHYTGQAPYSSKEKEHYTGQAIRERMVELDFKEGFVEKMLKDYSLKKIEEKLDLLLERKNIKSPAGWLRTALKNDYRGEEPAEQPSCTRSHLHLNPPPSKGEETRGIDSRFHGNDRGRRGNDIGGSGNNEGMTEGGAGMT
jgi:hypothetical protein